jgi:hypothetical protein
MQRGIILAVSGIVQTYVRNNQKNRSIPIVRRRMRFLFVSFCFLAIIIFADCDSSKLEPKSGESTGMESSSRILFGDSSYSKIEFVKTGTDTNRIITTQQFLWDMPYRKYPKPSECEVAISQQVKWIERPGKEGNDPSLQASCYLIENGRKVRPLWQINQEADEGSIWFHIYKTVWYGCCSARPNTTLYNIMTGTKLLEYSRDELLTIEIPNSPLEVRYIGYKCVETTLHEDYELKGNYFGTITYSSVDSCLEKFVIRMRSQADYEKYGVFGEAHISFIPDATKNKIGPESRLVLWAANGAKSSNAISGISIQFESCDNPPCFYRINLRNDTLDLSSIADSGLVITRIK